MTVAPRSLINCFPNVYLIERKEANNVLFLAQIIYI